MDQELKLAKLLQQRPEEIYKILSWRSEDYEQSYDDVHSDHKNAFRLMAKWILDNKELIYGI